MEAFGSIESISYEEPSISLGEKPDPIQMEDSVKKNLSERVVADLTSEKTTHYHLDSCINIFSYTIPFLQEMAQKCLELGNVWTNVRTITALASCAALLTAIPMPFFGIPLAVIGIAGTAYSHYKVLNISAENLQWNTIPYQKPAEFRALAYAEPVRIFHPDQGSFLHRIEVEYLYKKYLTSFCEKLLQENPSTDLEKKTWIASFLTLNPLSPWMMKYGWEKVPAAFEELSQEYCRYFSESIHYDKLHSRFASSLFLPGLGPKGPLGRTGIFPSSSYLYALEGLVITYEQALQDLKFAYSLAKENLKFQYRLQLEKLSQDSLHALSKLNDQFEYDLKYLKDPYVVQSQSLKTKYQEDLQKLKTQFTTQEPNELEKHLDNRWNELQTIFIEDQRSAVYQHQYENIDTYAKARSLLEKATKALNPPPIEVKAPPPKTTPTPQERDGIDARDLLYCPF